MSAPMKKHPTKRLVNVTWHGAHYAVPIDILRKYKIANDEESLETIESVFGDLISEYGESAVLLKGLRTRENLSQVKFAKAIEVSQANLSAMENGRRPIGKLIAKRIAKKFGVDYRIFL